MVEQNGIVGANIEIDSDHVLHQLRGIIHERLWILPPTMGSADDSRGYIALHFAYDAALTPLARIARSVGGSY